MKKEEQKIVIYKTKNGEVKISTRLVDDTIWASQSEMVALFSTDQSVISRHLNSIFNSGELDKKSNMQKMHIPTVSILE